MSEQEIEAMAANGFKVSVRLLSYALNCSYEDTLLRIAQHLERDILVINTWTRTGIKQDRLIESYLQLLKSHDVAFAKHQLRPTKKIIAIQKWSNENA